MILTYTSEYFANGWIPLLYLLLHMERNGKSQNIILNQMKASAGFVKSIKLSLTELFGEDASECGKHAGYYR